MFPKHFSELLFYGSFEMFAGNKREYKIHLLGRHSVQSNVQEVDSTVSMAISRLIASLQCQHKLLSCSLVSLDQVEWNRGQFRENPSFGL